LSVSPQVSPLESNSYYLTSISVACCRECKASAIQNSSGGKGNPIEGTEAEGDIAPAEEPKNDAEALKIRCSALEKTVKKLESVCNTHERLLEAYRQEIINIRKDQGALDLSYQGEEFELMGSKVASDTIE
jgi:hypothetical protein